MSGGLNGARPSTGDPAGDAAPAEVADLAEACVRFVERALQMRLDYEPETLPLLDHYVQHARRLVGAGEGGEGSGHTLPTAEPLVAQAVGAYFGEVVRRRHRGWWSLRGDAPSLWEVQLEAAHLSIHPVELAYAALEPAADEPAADALRVELLEEDREAVADRLADLPEVSEEEYRSLSTILEVIDIAVDAIRARRAAAGEPPSLLTPRDYEVEPEE